jgi:hypothetical protein
LNKVINEHREKLRKKNLTLQPTPVIVGPLDDIVASYVVLNTEKYAFDSVAAAVHFSFQLFFALGAKYPEEAQLVWQLLQIALYNIRIPREDARSIELSTLIGRLTL